jgi:biotin carboxylase
MQPCLLLVGTIPFREFVVDEVLRVAATLGLSVLLVDREDTQPAARSSRLKGVVTAPIGDNDPSAEAEVCARVERYCADHQIEITGVYAPFNPYVEVGARLAECFSAAGNSYSSVRACQSKLGMRRALAADPLLSTPFKVLRYEREAREWLTELGGAFVIKPSRGAGSRGVITGIESADAAALAFRNVSHYLSRSCSEAAAVLRSNSGDYSIVMERQLDGPEVDVELVLQEGTTCFAAVADNPEIRLPDLIETSSTYPSSLSSGRQNDFITCAQRALQLLGMRNGNFHVEMVETHAGPKVIEINVRMGGAFVWHAIKEAYGVSLIEFGIKALYGALSEADPLPKHGQVIESKFFIPNTTGTLVGCVGLDTLGQMSGIVHYQLWKSMGDSVLSYANDASDYLGTVLAAGSSHEQAQRNATAALAGVAFQILDSNGQVQTSPGEFMHDASVLIAQPPKSYASKNK